MKPVFSALIILLSVSTVAAQNVGIGTTIPLQKLHVQGNTFISDSLGIGTPAPAFPLSFTPAFGSKISLMNAATNGGIFGMGVQPGLLQLFADSAASDIVLGFGTSTAFTENMRITGSGKAGIGTSAPLQKLHVQGTTYISDSLGIGTPAPAYPLSFAPAFGDKISLMNTATNGGIFGIGTQFRLLQLLADSAQSDIVFGYGSSAAFTENMRIAGNGRVGIGTASPGYWLDVRHGGASGIRNRSDTSFSVIDIDAFNGDAALRFVSNGVNQWNIRNRPADNYLEIFEMGGGGSRMVIQDSTGNVGIGTLAVPAFKLDVAHFGNDGARIRSVSGASFIDIDAFSGDAGLRFTRSGVAQWNIRNRTADNSLEFFEQGAGGVRMVIQDASGNVGIGVLSPAYRMEVVHGGGLNGTGLRVKSTDNFSTVDIDGFSGDAAVRFANNGVNQWNIRNRPVDNYLEIFELGGGGSRVVLQDGTGNLGIGFAIPTAKLHIGGSMTATGAKAFTIDHPLDPENKLLRHFAIESNEVLNSYSGNVVTGADGKALVQLPAYFDAINTDFRYQLTVIGAFTQAIVSKKISGNQFEIATAQPGVEVSWEVKAKRNDGYMKYVNTLQAEEMKPAEMRGRYIEPGAFQLSESRGVNYSANMAGANGQPSSLTYTAPAATTGKQMPATGNVEDRPQPATAYKAPDNSGSVKDEAPKKTMPPSAMAKPAGKSSTDQ